MTITSTGGPTPRRPLRLWPGVAVVILQWLAWLVVPLVVADATLFAVAGGMLGGVAVAVWWLFFSRARWAERLGAIVLMVTAVAATRPVVHPSLANGMMGLLLPIYAVPAMSLALVVWAVAARGLSGARRHAALVAAVAIGCAAFTLLRTEGVTGAGDSDLHWRWTPSPEQRLLAQAGTIVNSVALASAAAPAAALPAGEAPAAAPAARAAAMPPPEPASPEEAAPVAEWPGFRGPLRDSVVRGLRINTDWSASPPVELWRRAVGPGWSSVAVRGDLLYTQEQRGDDEVVSCYRVSTGAPVWQHRDAARFWESNAGAGPRGTPTLGDGRVYTLGATGILNALDAGTGAVAWSHNAASDTGATRPDWGFSGSPLVVGDLVIVAAAGTLAAYDRATGSRRWTGSARGGGYSSPHLLTIDGEAQILLMSDAGAAGVAPEDGSLLWEYVWPGAAIVQPAQIAGGAILVSTGSANGGLGMRLLSVARTPAEWTVGERWTTAGLKPYFNDFVVHKGHAFGFDGSILACINLEDGTRAWKGGRYGYGQLVLLADQDVLLVLSEDGDLALVEATSGQFRELARRPAIEGKTWNHPTLVGDVLLVRNGREMAAFRLPAAPR